MTEQPSSPAFRVTTADEVTTNYDGKFTFKEGGVLMIVQNDGPTIYLSPGFWQSIDDRAAQRGGGRVI